MGKGDNYNISQSFIHKFTNFSNFLKSYLGKLTVSGNSMSLKTSNTQKYAAIKSFASRESEGTFEIFFAKSWTIQNLSHLKKDFRLQFWIDFNCEGEQSEEVTDCSLSIGQSNDNRGLLEVPSVIKVHADKIVSKMPRYFALKVMDNDSAFKIGNW